MKNILKVAALAVALVTGATFAPQAASAQTLIVDTDQVFTQSEAGKSGINQIKGKYEERVQRANTAFTTALNAWNTQAEAAQKLIKTNPTLPAATEASLKTARQNLNDAQQNNEAVRQELQVIQQYVQSQIVEVLIPVVEKIRADRRAPAVMTRSSVIAFDPANDITTLAIQEVNKKLTTVSIVLPQQTQAPAATGTAPAQPAKTQPQTR